MTPDFDAQAALRAEGLRVIPGVLACRERGDIEGAVVLMDGFWEVAQRLKVPQQLAWPVLWSASLHWLSELAAAYAECEDVGVDQVVEGLGASAASWMSEERGVGGY